MSRTEEQDCLVCLFESYPTDAERTVFVAAVLAESAKRPKRGVSLCDRHFADMALACERVDSPLAVSKSRS